MADSDNIIKSKDFEPVKISGEVKTPQKSVEIGEKFAQNDKISNYLKEKHKEYSFVAQDYLTDKQILSRLKKDGIYDEKESKDLFINKSLHNWATNVPEDLIVSVNKKDLRFFNKKLNLLESINHSS